MRRDGGQLGPLTLVAFGMPGMPLAMLGLPVVMVVPAAYAALPALDVTAVGLAVLLSKLWDVVSDPVIGAVNDRSGSRFRRRALLVAGTPVLLAGLYLLMHPATDAGFGYLLGISVLFYTGWTLITIPFLAWGAELSTTRRLQTRIASSREAWVVVGLLLSVTLVLPEAAADPAHAMARLADLAMLSLPIAILLAVVATPEHGHRDGQRPAADYRSFLRHRGTRLLFGSYVLNGIANAVPASLFLLFVTHYLDASASVTLLLATYFGAGLLGLMLWQPVIRRHGAASAWIASMVLASLAFCWVPLLDQGDVWAFAVICAVSGLSVGVDMALPAALQAGLLQHQSDSQRRIDAGFTFGAWGMATKIAMAFGIGIAFPLLGLVGFEPEGDNSASALAGLALTYGALPIVFKAAAIFIAFRFHRHQAEISKHQEVNFETQDPDAGHDRHPAAERV